MKCWMEIENGRCFNYFMVGFEVNICSFNLVLFLYIYLFYIDIFVDLDYRKVFNV